MNTKESGKDGAAISSKRKSRRTTALKCPAESDAGEPAEVSRPQLYRRGFSVLTVPRTLTLRPLLQKEIKPMQMKLDLPGKVCGNKQGRRDR
jgi:hypothetical protein